MKMKMKMTVVVGRRSIGIREEDEYGTRSVGKIIVGTW